MGGASHEFLIDACSYPARSNMSLLDAARAHLAVPVRSESGLWVGLKYMGPRQQVSVFQLVIVFLFPIKVTSFDMQRIPHPLLYIDAAMRWVWARNVSLLMLVKFTPERRLVRAQVRQVAVVLQS